MPICDSLCTESRGLGGFPYHVDMVLAWEENLCDKRSDMHSTAQPTFNPRRAAPTVPPLAPSLHRTAQRMHRRHGSHALESATCAAAPGAAPLPPARKAAWSGERRRTAAPILLQTTHASPAAGAGMALLLLLAASPPAHGNSAAPSAAPSASAAACGIGAIPPRISGGLASPHLRTKRKKPKQLQVKGS